jgi:2-dehydro-3-deoxyphosphogluconate aldolase/(4S)-4-hydroxy-2-oxoglutarate aldolase
MIDVRDRLGDRPVIAVLRAPDASRFVAVSEVLYDAGIRCLEYTLTTAGALDALRAARYALPEAVLGVGTVRTVQQVHAAVDAGAEFLVSQTFDRAVVAAAHAHGRPFIPGALTPTEIVTAWSAGVQAVKVSPIGPAGGIDYVSELVGPLPDIPLLPTGGVLVDEVGAYLRAGAALVGLSRDLIRDALTGGDLSALRERAKRAVASVENR